MNGKRLRKEIGRVIRFETSASICIEEVAKKIESLLRDESEDVKRLVEAAKEVASSACNDVDCRDMDELRSALAPFAGLAEGESQPETPDLEQQAENFRLNMVQELQHCWRSNEDLAAQVELLRRQFRNHSHITRSPE